MTTSQDPLDQAFGLLKARSCGRATIDLDLEKRMMKEHSSHGKSRKSTWLKVAAVVLLCLVAGGTTIAALAKLEEKGMRSALIEAVRTAADKAAEVGK